MSAVATVSPGALVLHQTRVIAIGTEKRIVTRCNEERVAVIWLSRDAATDHDRRPIQDCGNCARLVQVAS